MLFVKNITFLCLFILFSLFYINCETNENDSGSKYTFKSEKDNENKETFQFQAQQSRVMKIIINSLYGNKEIFIRELVSNAQDALSKARFESLKDSNYLSDFANLAIWIKYDSVNKTLIIKDSGVGMTKEELIKNLGTIAKSGTNEFFEKIQKAHDKSTNNRDMETLVGQFGVGFYSSFLVSDKVTVISKSNHDDQYIWESDSETFTVVKDPRGNTLTRGTAIILHLKDTASEYLNFEKLEQLIKKYNQFINFPINLAKETEKKVNVSNENETDEVQDDVVKEKIVKNYEYFLTNKVKPVWLRDSKEVSEDEYLSLYRSLSDEKEGSYSLKVHFNADGNLRFKALVFVPKVPPAIDSSSNYEKFLERVKLYVKRVYIKSALQTIFPPYLQFAVGIIDSDDLPLNVGREHIQHEKLLAVFKKKIVRKIIQSFLKISPQDYITFYGNYSNSIKYGITIDPSNRVSLIKLLRFYSSFTVKKNETMSSIDDYIKRMPKSQKQILYATCPALKECETSPFSSSIIQRGYEVLYMTDSIDDYVMNHANEYNMIKFHNVAKQGVEIEDDSEISTIFKETADEYKHLIKFWTETSKYKKFVGSANISLDMEPPCVLVADKFGFTGNMERIFKSQAKQGGPNADRMNEVLSRKKHIIFNAYHPLVKAMNELIDEGKTEKDEELNDLVKSCYAIGLLNGGFSMSNLNKIALILENSVIRSLGRIPTEVREDIREEIEKIQNLRLSKTESTDDESNSDQSQKSESDDESNSDQDQESKSDDESKSDQESKKDDESKPDQGQNQDNSADNADKKIEL